MRDERPECAAAPSLTRIALGGTERRLHRDSERLFRLVSSAAGALGLGFAGLRRERVQVPLVLVENAELVDRYTLACLLHLCRVSRGPGPVLVLATGEDDGAARPRWAAPPLADPLLARRTDAEAELGRVLGRFFTTVGAVEVRTVEGGAVEGETEAEAVVGEVAEDAGSADEWRALVRAVLLGDPELAAVLGEPLPERLAALSLVPAVRRAVRDRLGAEERRRACAELVARLRTSTAGAPPEQDGEGRELLLAHVEAGAGDTDAATRRALRLVQRSYGLTLNYAGFNTRRAPIEAYSLAEWDSLLAVDLRAPFLLSQQAVRDMAAGGSGHIVNVLSTAAHTAIPFMAPYVAAKAGLLAMTRVLALEANRHGIRGSTVSPGATDSAGTGEERAVRPESVGAVIAATVFAPPDVMAAEIIVRPTALDG
ncbi:SDR family oxidoreductase [Streptomyces sp. NPDC059985]|uniref:SDR family oxidoreductase n=1 Tax=Streptomyces sp. NPDC059985 TaxID=3347025 RepID=UPI0036C239CB